MIRSAAKQSSLKPKGIMDVQMFNHVRLVLAVTLLIFVNASAQPTKSEQPTRRGSSQSDIKEPLPGMTFVQITGGSFMMGSSAGQPDVRPVHSVDVKSFRIMTTEVTVGQFRNFADATGYKSEAEKGDGAYILDDDIWVLRSDANWRKPYFKQTNEHPVVCVSWNDAKSFIDWLNLQDSINVYRLPSEAEWEYACRAGTTTAYSTGETESDLAHAGWYAGNSNSKTHPVGKKKPNAWGLYDMHGNVWEWCEDWYHDSYDNASSDGRAWVSPEGTFRVLRGGSWFYYDWFCQSSYRGRYFPDVRYSGIGFRVVASSRP